MLGLDTSTAAGSIALVRQGHQLAGFQRRSSLTHSRRLLPAVDFVLAEAELSPAALDGFAVAVGPGSFTGLRIGLATVMGLARALDRPVVAVPTLEAYAWHIAGYGHTLAPVIDAHRGEVFTARFAAPSGTPERLSEDVVVSPEEAFRLDATDLVFFGDAVRRYGHLLEKGGGASTVDHEPFVAWEVARLGAAALERGEGVEAHALRAHYVRLSDAETSGPRPLARRV